MLLDAAYVAGAVQLGYAVTDYGNQGVTADRSVTWVSDATTAGGLYVGATRGRRHNAVHVVAADLDAAGEQIVAATGRDRADRGLDAARALVQTVPDPDPATSAPSTAAAVVVNPAVVVDPVQWRTAAERG